MITHSIISAATSWDELLFEPKLGDLLFQELHCGSLCKGIGKVTYGVDNTVISHVAMVIDVTPGNQQVIEALSAGVVITPLQKFLARSLDTHGKPQVIVGRLTFEYQALIPAALTYAKALVGQPYNPSFNPTAKGYYCSQLIAMVFQRANHGKAIFVTMPMNFQDPTTHQLIPAWQRYFKQLQQSPPQGLMGTNPGAMSRAPLISIVYRYGELSHHARVPTGVNPNNSTTGGTDYSIGFTIFHSL